jgi:hypothetical protein
VLLPPGFSKSVAMDRRGLHSYLGAGAKTSLGVCLTELNLPIYNWYILEPVTKKLFSPLIK